MSNKNKTIDIVTIARRIGNKKKLFLKVSIITFILSCVIILPVPRYYVCEVELAPEIGVAEGGSSLSDLASTFGLNIGSGITGDAISPDLYPELLKSNDFIYNLITCPIKTTDGKVSTTYYDYLLKHQKKNPLTAPIRWIGGLFQKKKESKPIKAINKFNLTEEESNIFGKIKDHISCQIDLKTRKITLSVEDQDPLVTATMAEQLRRKLQEFITRYRTSKSQRDLEYYTKLSRQAKAEYEKARQRYSSFSDANMDAILVSYNSKKDDLENEMQLKYNAYTALNTQMQTARAKVQETTPAFTTIKEASVPLLPAGPKRMAFVAAMLILSWIVTAFYSCRDLFVNSFLHEE